MSEIEKMYKSAGVEPYKICNSCIDDNSNKITSSKNCSFRNLCGNTCDEPHYILTAKKQIELIKWLARNEMLCRLEDEYPYFERFEECIAYIINYLWQFLSEEEKQQVKGILE